MKKIFKYLMLLWALPLFCLASCSDDEDPSSGNSTGGQTEGGGEVTPEPSVPQYEGFQGYMFVLDQSQIPNLGGYEADKTAPQAKLMYMAPDGSVCTDAFAEKQVEVNLGFECKMMKSEGCFVIYAKKESLSDENSKSKVTVVEGKSLEIISQCTFSFDEEYADPDFFAVVNPKTAYVGFNQSNIYSLDLKSGAVKKFIDFDYNNAVEAVGYHGSIFFFNGTTIRVMSAETGTVNEEIRVDKPIYRGYDMSDDRIFLRTDSGEAYILSLKERKVIRELKAFDELSFKGMVYDSRNDVLYGSGKSSKRDEVYIVDLKKPEPQCELFYTIPSSDINKVKQVTGSIRLGINPDTHDLYVAHVADVVLVGALGQQRSTREGYISRIALNGKEEQLPLTTPDAKTRIEDMFQFSTVMFLGKE